MVSTRLIRLIELHAEELSATVARDLKNNPKTPTFQRFTDTEIQQRVYRVYKNLGVWIMSTSEDDIRNAYEALGRERQQEGVPLPEVVHALIVNKNRLIDFVRTQGLGGSALEVYAELELIEKVTRFYDIAIYYTAAGYTSVGAKRQAA